MIGLEADGLIYFVHRCEDGTWRYWDRETCRMRAPFVSCGEAARAAADESAGQSFIIIYGGILLADEVQP